MGQSKTKTGWGYTFRYQGERYRKQGFQTKTAAREAENKLREELKTPPMKTGLAFSEICNKYLMSLEGRMTSNTTRQKAFVYRQFVTFLGYDPEVDSITPELVQEFLSHERKRIQAENDIRIQKVAEHNKKALKNKKLKKKEVGRLVDQNKAANRYLRDLSALFTWAQRNWLMARNPCLSIEKYREKPFRRYVPPIEDYRRVLLMAGEDRDLVETVHFTGARVSEVLSLVWDDVDFETRRITLYTRKRKGGELEPRQVAMGPKLLAIVQRLWKSRDKRSPYVFTNPRTGRRYVYNSRIEKLIKRLCAKAQVKEFNWHSLRHLAAHIAKEKGIETRDVGKFLGHKRESTTETYLGSLVPGLEAVSDALEEADENKAANQV